MRADNKLIVKTNLKRYRLRTTKLTQKEVAELCGIPLRTYQAYEQGERKIGRANIGYIKALAQLFELDCNCVGLIF